MKHYNLIISGKVHDVFFRDSTLARALELKLFGFVKNRSDGTVYIEIEGSEEKLKPFIEWCHHGPEFAQVKNIEIIEGELRNFSDFSIQ